MNTESTVVAIASSTSPANRGVVRLSGGDCMAVIDRVASDLSAVERPSADHVSIDLGPPLGIVDAMLLRWPTRRSYTGQPSAEIHAIGSLPVLSALVNQCVEAGARPAQGGEFTMRAFLAGRLDLTEAEAVLGVIEADDAASLNASLQQLAGNVGSPLGEARDRLLNLLADVEAGLDFVDEDIEFIERTDLIEQLGELHRRVDSIAKQLTQRGGSSQYVDVSLHGFPNAGKSSLCNALAGDNIAIVADVAGTTRDVVVAKASIGPYTVRLFDTAGIESVDGNASLKHISTSAQTVADQAMKRSSIRLWCVDGSNSLAIEQCEKLYARSRLYDHQSNIFVCTKSDRLSTDPPPGLIACSTRTFEGMPELRKAIETVIEMQVADRGSGVHATASRCKSSMAESIEAIEKAIEIANQDSGDEFLSAELRRAAEAIGQVTGAVYNDDILDRVFSRFCIGK